LYHETCFEGFYQQNALYRIFFHQAVLAGTVLSSMDWQEIQELSHLINYPLHMHAEYPADRRPEYMNELITSRYDVFFKDPNWREIFPVKEPLKSWLTEQLRMTGKWLSLLPFPNGTVCEQGRSFGRVTVTRR
jgi:hypothetical protein